MRRFCIGEAPRIFLGDLVARPGDLVVLPLRQHVVDAVEADHRLHVDADRGSVRIVPILGREQRLVAGQRHQRHQMRAGGIAHQADAIRIDAEPGGLGAHELDRRLDVIDRARKR